MPKGQTPRGTIVQFHGNAENLSSHYAGLAWLVARGFNLFVFDYRGYGKSEGDPSQEGLYKDALAALDQALVLHQTSRARRLIIVGQSLGGAVALRALQDWPGRADLLVLDSTFRSYRKMGSKFLSRHWYTWALSPLPYALVSDAYAARGTPSGTRLLVIHDREDPVVPFELGRELYDQATGPKDLWVLDNGYHVGDLPPAEREKLVALLSG